MLNVYIDWIYSAMKTVNDCKNLQESLGVLYNWSRAWQLSISYKKRSFMAIGKLKNEKDLSFQLGDNNIRGLYLGKKLPKIFAFVQRAARNFPVISAKLLLKHTLELVLYTSVSCPKTETF